MDESLAVKSAMKLKDVMKLIRRALGVDLLRLL